MVLCLCRFLQGLPWLPLPALCPVTVGEHWSRRGGCTWVQTVFQGNRRTLKSAGQNCIRGQGHLCAPILAWTLVGMCKHASMHALQLGSACMTAVCFVLCFFVVFFSNVTARVYCRHCVATSSYLSLLLIQWVGHQARRGEKKENDLTPSCAFGEEGLEACQLCSGSASPLCPSYFFPSAGPKLWKYPP